jgi:hypothetical protein
MPVGCIPIEFRSSSNPQEIFRCGIFVKFGLAMAEMPEGAGGEPVSALASDTS